MIPRKLGPGENQGMRDTKCGLGIRSTIRNSIHIIIIAPVIRYIKHNGFRCISMHYLIALYWTGGLGGRYVTLGMGQ